MEKSIHNEEKREQLQNCGLVMLFVCFAAIAWLAVSVAQGTVFCATFFLPGYRK